MIAKSPKMKDYSLIFIVLVISCFTISFNPKNTEYAKRKNLSVSFEVNKIKNVKVNPSYCMAIWLEKADGQFYSTLYLSDWLAYGGFSHEGVCPTWLEKSNWASNATEDLADAISGATPRFGDTEMSFRCSNKNIPQGVYNYRIEVHVTAEYNEVYSGEIEIGESTVESIAEVVYIPEQHEEASGLLSEVKVICE